MFENAKFIWRTRGAAPDDYAEFRFTTEYSGGERNLAVTAGSDYNVYVNGKLAFFGQYPDYPEHRYYDILPLGDVLSEGSNVIDIVVWYYGTESAGYVVSDAYLAFELTDGDGRLLAVSDESILSRTPAGYVRHKCKNITGQIGLGWEYDATLEAGDFSPSVPLPIPSCEWNVRPIKKTEIKPLIGGKLIDEGYFTYTKADERPAELMQRATFSETPEGSDGKYYIFDLGREYVGYPEIFFGSDSECDIMIGWGEHFIDGRCRTSTRNYDAEFHAKAGENHLLASFRRWGCRYLQIFVIKNDIKIRSFGIRPVDYPVTALPAPAKLNDLQKKIYETCVHTLICCMHDHYEDCPWREQALYTLDSRNQMLCGYHCFEGGNYDYARACLKLISYGQRPDGILSLTFPTSIDSPLPYYTLAYFIQLDEYVRYSGDTTIAGEVFPLLVDLLGVFRSRLNKDDLIERFDGAWNYYEWAETLDGGTQTPGEVDAPLAAFYVLALRAMSSLCSSLGKEHTEYDEVAERVRAAIGKAFYDSETKLFRTSLNTNLGKYAVLTNSVCLLCGAADGYDTENIVEILAHNGAGSLPYYVIPNTLSMNSFRFDALLELDSEKYGPIIISEIDRDYKYMLDCGATTFWETIKGADDMWFGASVCHGWSSLPIYYYHKILCE